MALSDAQPRMAAADTRLLKLVGGGGRRSAFVGLLQDLVRKSDHAEAKPPKAEKPSKPKAKGKTKPAKVGKKARKKAA
jgi:hypothetical protein